MAIKAKFNCDRIVDTSFGQGGYRTVLFRAVYGTKGENASYSKATPSGTLEMQIDKETAAFDFFKPGKSYYLNIEEAPE